MKILTGILCALLLISSSSFAVESIQPTVIHAENEKIDFQVNVEDSTFELILNENPSTGYKWSFENSNAEEVVLLEDKNLEASSQVLGAPSKRVLIFQVKSQGIYTLKLSHKRSFEENSTLESLNLLVYKHDDKLIVEEDQVMTIMDKNDRQVIRDVIINDAAMTLDVKTDVIDGVVMVPLALPLRALGYDVVWHGESFTVEMSKGAKWTSIEIGKNAYFKNKMAAQSLSKAPVIKEGRTLVPVEFFSEVLDLAVRVEDYNLIFEEDLLQSKYAGVIKGILYDETGSGQITLSLGNHETSDKFLNETIVLNVGPAFTYIQGALEVGDEIVAYTSFATTKRLPPQTSAYIIYVLDTHLK